NSILISKSSNATTTISTNDPITPTVSLSDANSCDSSPTGSPKREEDLRHNLLGKVTGFFHKSITRSRDNSISSGRDPLDMLQSPPILKTPSAPCTPKESPSDVSTVTLNHYRFPQSPLKKSSPPVKETKKVFLEYDPISRRKVLNTYEILREIGKGEHGKVKLAKDLIHNELVAIKIVNRKSRRDRASMRMMRRSSSKPNAFHNDYEVKIKREIAIMKKCNHKHIVQLKEVLDDLNSNKIYLVLEYLEKGEIKWKRYESEAAVTPRTDEIPCCGSNPLYNIKHPHHEDDFLLSDIFSPNLTFRQSRKIFRDVLLGLEYLHLQGIVHRDIKPANLLVSSDNIVKISDFGVSFASSLNENDEGYLVNELELAKTAGTPAFFAPELCQTNFSSSTSELSSSRNSASSLEILKNDTLKITKILPKIDYKIDIWALGVTLYCLLFGKVPFNADSEYELFQVIVNQPLIFPENKDAFHSPTNVTEEEFDLAKDLLSKLLDKNCATRIEIKDIKIHPFTLMDLENDLVALDDLLHMNNVNDEDHVQLDFELEEKDIVSQEEIDNAVIGFGNRIKRSLVTAIRAGGMKDSEIRNKFAALQMEHSRSTSSEDSSSSNSNFNSSTRLTANLHNNHSMILSESFQVSTPPVSGAIINTRGISHQSDHHTSVPHVPSHLSQQLSPSPSVARSSSYSIAGISREGRSLLQDMIDSHSSSSSRRGSVGVIEAPQIETKRNVGGDLYLTNQSAMDAFKGIQEQDDKRRRNSSMFSSKHSQPSTAKNSISSASDENSKYHHHHINIAAPIPNQLKIGPISIENDRRPSSVMSLPLSESFASLDSINDEYLTLKYQEYTNNKLKLGESRGTEFHSDPNLFHHSPDDVTYNISEKFKVFDLGSSMKNQSVKEDSGNTGNSRNYDHEGIAPTTMPLSKYTTSSSYSSYSSKSTSSDEEDDSDEEGNLTLAFSSKVAHPSRPNFLTLNQRAKSHESNLPRLIHSSDPNNHPTYDVPIVFQADLPVFEDVPEDLMANVPAPTIDTHAIVASHSMVSSNGSSSTLTPDYSNASVSESNQNGKPGVSEAGAGKKIIANLNNSQVRVPSPLVNSMFHSKSTNAAIPSESKRKMGLRENIFNSQFNNHYKKDPVYSPFPKAIHLDNDKEALVRATSEKQNSNRPNYYRSNSITVGLLQHVRDGGSEDA
ncbi:predicted protein, partial [Scheffersomyces stipitis CBS 6054]